MMFEDVFLKDFGFNFFIDHQSYLNIRIAFFLIIFILYVPSCQHSLEPLAFIL